ncbi:MAG TPA: tRNA preQ1(34) S-adenosylmethionine ribosyltransferase-isomerase QueA [Polyangia bacterium]|jgi:S-adenosylmethionine:tRNA ribosyltransferase-isomerase
MKVSDFNFFLPPDRIAAYPRPERDASALLVMTRTGDDQTVSTFKRIGDFLPARSLLVVNETRVFPARLRGRKATGAQVELLLLSRSDDPSRPNEEVWEALARGLGRSRSGAEIEFPEGLRAALLSRGERGAVRVRLSVPEGRTVAGAIERVGEVPLPPYIVSARSGESPVASPRTAVDDRERYQTVYASSVGAVAAPTAGLHFTRELLQHLRDSGHDVAPLTLHVGPGTFRPVTAADTTEHVMETERYVVPAATAAAVAAARSSGRAIVAVGTTVVRTLEAAVRAGDGVVRAGDGRTNLFLEPGAEFRVVTDLITNFHLPCSTLLMLVSAFAGRERVLAAYERAMREGLRFYSYGDAMFIRGTR